MSIVAGRVVLPYGATRDTTPVCGHIRYVWVGGVQDRGTTVIAPGVAIARIIDGVAEPVHLSPGRWLPVLVVDERRYDLPEIIVDKPGPPEPVPEPEPEPHAPTVEVLGDGAYTITAASVAATDDGAYAVELDGARYTIAHTGDGTYEIKEAMSG